LGLADEPFTYKVRTIRDGNNYSVKQVDVVQEDGVKIVFTSTISFKKSEANFLNVQVKENLAKKYSQILGGKTVDELPLNTNVTSLM
jgi:acyl-CoA thioesterase